MEIFAVRFFINIDTNMVAGNSVLMIVHPTKTYISTQKKSEIAFVSKEKNGIIVEFTRENNIQDKIYFPGENKKTFISMFALRKDFWEQEKDIQGRILKYVKEHEFSKLIGKKEESYGVIDIDKIDVVLEKYSNMDAALKKYMFIEVSGVGYIKTIDT